MLLAVAAVAVLSPALWAQDFDQRAPAPPPRARSAPVLTKPPAIKKDATPVYPPAALAAGLSADVPLFLDLDAAGLVTAAEVTRPAGNGFDEAAVSAARQMEFTPAEIDGKPAAIRIEYVLHFRPRVHEAADGGVPSSADAGAPSDGGADQREQAATDHEDGTDAGAPPALAPPPVAAPIVILRGRAREKGTREPLAGAAVLLIERAAGEGADRPARQVATTDAEGAFELLLPAGTSPAGGLRLIVTEPAHDPCLRDLSAAQVGAAASAPLTWSCFARPNDRVYQTRVRAARAANDVTRHSLSVPELTTVPGTFGDPLRVLQNLPGVSRAPYGLGLLIVRGAPPTDTGVFVGGQQIPQLYHFLVGPSVIAPHLIDRVDFFPGGFGVRYGRASGGAVDVQLKEGPATGFHGGADLSVLDVSAFAEGPLHGGRSPGADGTSASTTTATVAVRRSTIDALLPLVVPRQQGSTFVTTVPVYWDYQARIVHEMGGTRGRIGVMAFGSDDTLKLVAQDPQAGDFSLNTHNGFHRVIAYWAGSIAGWTGRLSPAYGNGEDSFSLGSTSG